MTSKKNTNKALFSSVIALILCCSMLVGTTFAWFTDEVTSGVNKIVAGNLDVDVLTADGDSIQGIKTLFNDVTLWEPGVVAYENLTVVNQGNLALKYELSVNFDNENTVNGNGLSKALSVAVVPGGVSGSREQILAAAGNGVKLTELLESGALLKGEEKVYGIVIWWQPSANDNDWNVNNGKTTSDGKALHIDLGVNLHAWQKDAEKDSFDETYDAVVHSAVQLADALKKGGNIKVGSNIEATETINVPANVTATLDLNGKTLTGAILAPQADLTVSNGTLKNENPDASALEINAGKLTLDNVQVNSARHGLRVDGAVEVTINGGTYRILETKGKTQHALNVSGNAKVTINGGTFVGPKGTTADSGAAVNVQAGATVIINGGNFSGGKNNTLASKGTLQVYGGTFDQNPTAFAAAGYTAANMGNGTWTVVKGEIAVSDADELAAAVAAGKTDIYLLDGEYDVYSCGGKTLTLTGSKGAVLKVMNEGEDGCDYAFATNGNVTFNGLTIDTTSNTGNYKGYAYMNAVYNDCTFVGGGFTTVNGGTYVFNDCTFDLDGYVWTWGATQTDFNRCKFVGNSKAILAHGYASTVITIKDCTFAATEKGYTGAGDNTAAVEMDPAGTNTYTVKITGSTLTESYADWYRVKDGSTGHSVYVNGDDVINTIEIGTLAELLAFAKDVNVNGNNYSGKTVVLTADIDLRNKEWTPVGQAGGNDVATYFQGRFDGKGHTISNLTITNNAYDKGEHYAAGFFGFVDAGDANIVNLTINGANVNGHHWTGVIAGYLTGNISGCTVKNAAVNCTHANGDACGDKAGVIVGYVNNGTVTGNTVEDCTVTAGRDAGQVAGCAKAVYVHDNTISNVVVSAAGGCTGANIRNEEIGRLY